MRTWYEVYAEPRIRPNTKAYYTNYIENHIIPGIGNISLDTLTHTGKGAESTEQGRTGFFLSGPVFSAHLLADDPTDGVGGILLHLRRGVGVGVQGEPSRVVAQRARQRFHVYPAF